MTDGRENSKKFFAVFTEWTSIRRRAGSPPSVFTWLIWINFLRETFRSCKKRVTSYRGWFITRIMAEGRSKAIFGAEISLPIIPTIRLMLIWSSVIHLGAALR